VEIYYNIMKQVINNIRVDHNLRSDNDINKLRVNNQELLVYTRQI